MTAGIASPNKAQTILTSVAVQRIGTSNAVETSVDQWARVTVLLAYHRMN
jgi:hypothetical protein